jgi:hypothetical protein
MANPNVPPNPARATVDAALGKHGAGPQPQPPQRFSPSAIQLHATHAAERAQLEAEQWNARVDMTERHAAEVAALREKEEKQQAANDQLAAAAAAQPAPPPAPAPVRRR